MTTGDLYGAILSKGTCLCVGLDTDPGRLPECITSKAGSMEDAVLEFNKAIIDATAPHCVAFKPNLAFYEALGSRGMAVLEKTVDHIRQNHPGMFLIADAKRGDIGNTAKQYARTFFEVMDFDAVTLSPYMGVDTVLPFLDYPGRFAIVVALSSNASATDFQMVASEGKPMWQLVMEKMREVSSAENMMFVVGATKASLMQDVRRVAPDNFLLVPGVGAQGGSAAEVIANGANPMCGLLINSSRGVIYASSGADFASAAAAAASAAVPYRG